MLAVVPTHTHPIGELQPIATAAIWPEISDRQRLLTEPAALVFRGFDDSAHYAHVLSW
jgi:hypothetical protein